MDNITHTLAGAAVAELAVRGRGLRGANVETLRPAAWVGAMLASNAPDVDFVLTPLLRSPLGYLLHHRGHTHTVLVAPLVAAACWAIARAYGRRRGGPFAGEGAFLFALCVASAWLHIAMDFGNSYGVHAFWPFDARWQYGDAVFIVEPLLWAALAIPLAFAAETRNARIVLGGVAAAGVVLSATVPLVSWVGLALVVVLSVLTALLARASGPFARALVAVVLALGLEAMFFATSHEARIRAEGVLAAAFPRATTLDVALSPAPANPLCWSAVSAQLENDELVLRRFSLSLVPAMQHVDECRLTASLETTAITTPIARTSTEAVAFGGETHTPLALVRALAEESGEVAAYLRFARAPFFAEDGDEVIAGDYRYDREGGPGFSEGRLRREGPIEGWVPGWEMPRLDAVDPAHAPAPRSHDIVVE
jgi:inner membrane protein